MENNPFGLPDNIKIAIHAEAGFSWHNLTCWVCGENSAVYYMHPYWVFAPCRECQSKFDSPVWTKRKPRWMFWIDSTDYRKRCLQRLLS